jgi:hypothetical protein
VHQVGLFSTSFYQCRRVVVSSMDCNDNLKLSWAIFKSVTDEVRNCENLFFILFIFDFCLCWKYLERVLGSLNYISFTETCARTKKTNRMHYLLSIYFNNKPMDVLSRLTAPDQEVLLRIYSNWYISRVYVDWLLARFCCIYRIVPPDDEQ